MVPRYKWHSDWSMPDNYITKSRGLNANRVNEKRKLDSIFYFAFCRSQWEMKNNFFFSVYVCFVLFLFVCLVFFLFWFFFFFFGGGGGGRGAGGRVDLDL